MSVSHVGYIAWYFVQESSPRVMGQHTIAFPLLRKAPIVLFSVVVCLISSSAFALPFCCVVLAYHLPCSVSLRPEPSVSLSQPAQQILDFVAFIWKVVSFSHACRTVRYLFFCHYVLFLSSGSSIPCLRVRQQECLTRNCCKFLLQASCKYQMSFLVVYFLYPCFSFVFAVVFFKSTAPLSISTFF
jgi:hypothetical protein